MNEFSLTARFHKLCCEPGVIKMPARCPSTTRVLTVCGLVNGSNRRAIQLFQLKPSLPNLKLGACAGKESRWWEWVCSVVLLAWPCEDAGWPIVSLATCGG